MIGDLSIFLGDKDGTIVDFDDETQTFTLMLIKIRLFFISSKGQVMTVSKITPIL